MNGKGSKPRPVSVPVDEYRRRWDATFSTNVTMLVSPFGEQSLTLCRCTRKPGKPCDCSEYADG